MIAKPGKGLVVRGAFQRAAEDTARRQLVILREKAEKGSA